MDVLITSVQFLIQMFAQFLQFFRVLSDLLQLCGIFLLQLLQLFRILLLHLANGSYAFLRKLCHLRSYRLGHQCLHRMIDCPQFLIDLLHLRQAFVIFPQLILQLIHFLCIRCGVGLDHLLGIQLLRKFIHKSIHPFSSKHIRPSCEPFSVSTAPILPCFSHGYNQNPRNTAFSKHVRFYAICTICFSVSVLFRKIHRVFTSCS